MHHPGRIPPVEVETNYYADISAGRPAKHTYPRVHETRDASNSQPGPFRYQAVHHHVPAWVVLQGYS
jgi:hypothetical protein